VTHGAAFRRPSPWPLGYGRTKTDYAPAHAQNSSSLILENLGRSSKLVEGVFGHSGVGALYGPDFQRARVGHATMRCARMTRQTPRSLLLVSICDPALTQRNYLSAENLRPVPNRVRVSLPGCRGTDRRDLSRMLQAHCLAASAPLRAPPCVTPRDTANGRSVT
jgi:hypothetical protein